MVYASGQVKNIFPYINFEPKWFLLGGPADGNEAQVFHEVYPDTKILGIEPNQEAFKFQTDFGFPGTLLPNALSSTNCSGRFQPNTIRSGWIVAQGKSPPTQTDAVDHPVEIITLDTLDREFGPFSEAILWIDIEEAEFKALEGANKLLQEKRIRLLNIEIIEPNLETNHELERFIQYLGEFGYKKVGEWNAGPLSPGPISRLRRDVIFSCEE